MFAPYSASAYSVEREVWDDALGREVEHEQFSNMVERTVRVHPSYANRKSAPPRPSGEAQSMKVFVEVEGSEVEGWSERNEEEGRAAEMAAPEQKRR